MDGTYFIIIIIIIIIIINNYRLVYDNKGLMLRSQGVLITLCLELYTLLTMKKNFVLSNIFLPITIRPS